MLDRIEFIAPGSAGGIGKSGDTIAGVIMNMNAVTGRNQADSVAGAQVGEMAVNGVEVGKCARIVQIEVFQTYNIIQSNGYSRARLLKLGFDSQRRALARL